MPRDPSLFYHLVDREPDMTELLCNLMRFDKFRCSILESLLGNEPCVARIRFEEINTRTTSDNDGSPDIVIENPEIFALLEIKTDPLRGLTKIQRDGGYLRALSKSPKQAERWLVFLVPDDWVHEKQTSAMLENPAKTDPNFRIQTGIKHWKKDVHDVIEKKDLSKDDPIISEFAQLLLDWFKPIMFSKGEVDMLFSTEFGGAVYELHRLVEAIRRISKDSYKQGNTTTGEVYFKYDTGDLFWFGIWPAAWKETRFPLCFGVKHERGREVLVENFRRSYKDLTNRDAFDFKENNKNWTLGYVPKELLESKNPEHHIWEELLKPMIREVQPTQDIKE